MKRPSASSSFDVKNRTVTSKDLKKNAVASKTLVDGRAVMGASYGPAGMNAVGGRSAWTDTGSLLSALSKRLPVVALRRVRGG